MGIKDEIYKEYFEKLKQNKEIPESILVELKKLKESGKITEGKITEIINKGCNNACEPKKT